MRCLTPLLTIIIVLLIWIFITPWLFTLANSSAFELGLATIIFGIIGIVFSFKQVAENE